MSVNDQTHQSQIDAATSAMFPGASVEWVNGEPAIIMPVSMQPKADEVIRFVIGYCYKLGYSIFLETDQPHIVNIK